jgi:hypothetical protein
LTVTRIGNDYSRRGFPSVGLGGILLSSGKWYYEVTILSPAVAQIGWADMEFKPSSSNGFGVGDDLHSWSYDGDRLYLWNSGSIPNFGKKWEPGDVLGCSIDLTVGKNLLRFSHNGSFENPLGDAFANVTFFGGVTMAFTAASTYFFYDEIFGNFF